MPTKTFRFTEAPPTEGPGFSEDFLFLSSPVQVKWNNDHRVRLRRSRRRTRGATKEPLINHTRLKVGLVDLGRLLFLLCSKSRLRFAIRLASHPRFRSPPPNLELFMVVCPFMHARPIRPSLSIRVMSKTGELIYDIVNVKRANFWVNYVRLRKQYPGDRKSVV